MAAEDGLICAYLLDGRGGGQELGWPEIRAWRPEQGLLWVHLDRIGSGSVRWLHDDSGLDPLMRDALLTDEVRPRELTVDEALLVILRGVNLNPGADPEDMVGLRIWLEPDRIVSLRHRPLMAVNDLRASIAAGQGPRTPGQFLAMVSAGLIARVGPGIEELVHIAVLGEDVVLTAESRVHRGDLANLRREAIALRRYLAPQREVMVRLCLCQAPWFQPEVRARLREVSVRTLRSVEDLDAARERAAVLQDELNNRLSDQMNRTMYVLTVAATVLMPPSLITGLLGINVGGMPGADNSWSFWMVILLLVFLAIVEVVILRRFKWI
jgi:zinc transporter